MDDNKIVNIFNNKAKVNFEGFKYVKISRDSNGIMFNEEKLLDYARSCHYIVRVMKKSANQVSLYNYDIPSESLSKFILSLEDDPTKGTIIEIEKFIPDNFA